MMSAIRRGFIVRAYDKDGNLIENQMKDNEVDALGCFDFLKTNSRFVRHGPVGAKVHLFHAVEITAPDGSSYQERMGDDGVWRPIEHGD